MSHKGNTLAFTLKNGLEFDTTFTTNPKTDSPFRWRATRINGQRASKVILSNDGRSQPGQLCRVRITSIKKPISKEHGHIEVEVLHQITFRLDDQVYVEPLLAKKLQALLECGRNILLDGPQGSGKTTLAGKVAEALGLEYIFFNCSAVYEATDFLATLQVRAGTSGQAETVWLPTDILRALEAAHTNPSKRYLIFLDEFNRCRELARNGIMPALDATRKLYNPLTGSTINIPENVLWIAAINNGPQFTGTTNVDPAQLDRFAPLKLEYPPIGEEVRLLKQRYPHVAPSQIERVVRAADAVRHAEGGPSNLGMRATDEVCMLLAHPNFSTCDDDPLPDLLKTSFCARIPGSWQDSATEAGQVWQVVVRTLEL